MEIPKFGEKLSVEQQEFISAISKSCRKTIIEMLKQSQSGHPGGSLSAIDYLSLLYSFVITQTGDNVIVSSGHISPAVYSILSEMGYARKQDIIDTFRQINSIYEGHVTRHVKGIQYGTGPLGVGVSTATGFALAEKIKNTDKKTYVLMGDGEAQEGQVYEAIHFANKYDLKNIILFIDYNKVQLTASLNEIMPIDLQSTFKAAGWNTINANGHDLNNLWEALSKAQNLSKPTAIIAETIMGKGVDYMEKEGQEMKSTWHGNAPSPELAEKAIAQLQLSEKEQNEITKIKNIIKWQPPNPQLTESLTQTPIKTGTPIIYTKDTLTDCRSAYGKALLDLAKLNKNVLALTADLRGSVKTEGVAQELPEQHIEVGIAEQQLVSLAGGLSLCGFVPFASTFGAFMTSRAKDQARVNDINQTNVKMVATHCGLSVGEDGPTHQAIDDKNSFLGFYNTMIIEPADPNQCDRIIRYIASHYGNFYVRMGRHKYPIITKEDGTPFYDDKYAYEYGKSDIIRNGENITIIASGPMIPVSLQAVDALKQSNPKLSIELIANSSIKKFDLATLNSIKKTGKVICIEDHNTTSGLGSQLATFLLQNKVYPKAFEIIGTTEYQFSGKAEDLYKKTGLSTEAITNKCLNI